MFSLLYRESTVIVRIEAESLNAVFVEAALAVRELITGGPCRVTAETQQQIQIRSQSETHLLWDWLSELLAIYEAENWLAVEFDVHVDGNAISACACGASIPFERRPAGSVIESICYEGLFVQQLGPQRWCADVPVKLML